MKKTLNRVLAIMLAVVMVFGAAPLSGLAGLTDWFKGLAVTASAASYTVGDIIEFGSYPQTRVTDSTLLTSLNSQTLTWVSYGYYSGTGSSGSQTQSDYMKYADITYGGNKYRAVKFTSYRPYYTTASSSASNSNQDDNGYSTSTIYWFKYEPLEWRVLDPSTGLLMCESIIDSQHFYPNEEYPTWANSSVRTWLNGLFYSTAFTSTEQSSISSSTVSTPDYNDNDGGVDTTDKLFLLSREEVTTASYGFSSSTSTNDTARGAQGSDYAKCQGLYVYNSVGEYYGNSNWWLRSPGYDSYYASFVNFYGYVDYFSYVCLTFIGVRPAFRISNLSSLIFTSYSGSSSGKTVLTMYDRDNETLLRSKSVEINSQSYTSSSSGTVKINSLQTVNTIKISGCYDYIFNSETVNNGKKTIYVESLKESTKPYISSVHYRNVTVGGEWKDACSEKIEIPQNSTELFDARIYAVARSSPVSKIVLSQDNAHKIESTTGVFTSKQLAATFVSGKTIYAYCVDANGMFSKPYETKINIAVARTLSDSEGGIFQTTVDVGGKKVTIPGSIPLIGEKEFGLDIGAYKATVKREGNKYKVAIGAGVDKKVYDDEDVFVKRKTSQSI